mmetsp:Transcript_106590/g.299485  ORF Transcript_106590/g.299485 Transcript_106590/m.299485 type:complete len:231 (+) Transcript_106590:247-939(+)
MARRTFLSSEGSNSNALDFRLSVLSLCVRFLPYLKAPFSKVAILLQDKSSTCRHGSSSSGGIWVMPLLLRLSSRRRGNDSFGHTRAFDLKLSTSRLTKSVFVRLFVSAHSAAKRISVSSLLSRLSACNCQTGNSSASLGSRFPQTKSSGWKTPSLNNAASERSRCVCGFLRQSASRALFCTSESSTATDNLRMGRSPGLETFARRSRSASDKVMLMSMRVNALTVTGIAG